MSGLDSFHISIPEPSDPNDPFNSFNHSKRSSMSSIRSGLSVPSPYDPPSEFLSYNEEEEPILQRRPSKKGVSTFISKLFTMVEDGHHQNLISWSPNGTSFFVCNATQFAQEVLPEYFKHSNFSSFVRLLNMYGFHKINKSLRGQRGNNENELWEFSHPKFQHNRSDLLKEIKRKAMDSELLRRETGDMHASFAMLQMSQADLLQQFYILQDNFSNLLQRFEQCKKVQMQQQIFIRQLIERQGLTQNDLLQNYFKEDHQQQQQQQQQQQPQQQQQQNQQHSATARPLAVFITSPTGDDQQANNAQAAGNNTCHYNPMQFVQGSGGQQHAYNNSNHLRHPLQSGTTPDVTMSMYDNTSNAPSPAGTSMSPSHMFDSAVNTPLPPSPAPSTGIMGSPALSDSGGDHGNQFHHRLRYNNVNTLGLGLSA